MGGHQIWQAKPYGEDPEVIWKRGVKHEPAPKLARNISYRHTWKRDLNNRQVSKSHLNNVYCDFRRCGYEPSIIMSAGGNISSIKLRFNKTLLSIRSQDLINSAVERSEYTDDPEVFNKVNEGMFYFNKGLFNSHHKSYYHKDDKKIFDSAYSIASTGYFDTEVMEGVEIDINKAYTKGTMDITRIPIFCEFDIWKKYDVEKHNFNKMNDLTLFYVKSKVKNMFF